MNWEQRCPETIMLLSLRFYVFEAHILFFREKAATLVPTPLRKLERKEIENVRMKLAEHVSRCPSCLAQMNASVGWFSQRRKQIIQEKLSRWVNPIEADCSNEEAVLTFIAQMEEGTKREAECPINPPRTEAAFSTTKPSEKEKAIMGHIRECDFCRTRWFLYKRDK